MYLQVQPFTSTKVIITEAMTRWHPRRIIFHLLRTAAVCSLIFIFWVNHHNAVPFYSSTYNSSLHMVDPRLSNITVHGRQWHTASMSSDNVTKVTRESRHFKEKKHIFRPKFNTKRRLPFAWAPDDNNLKIDAVKLLNVNKSHKNNVLIKPAGNVNSSDNKINTGDKNSQNISYMASKRLREGIENEILPHPTNAINPHNFPYIINNPDICPRDSRLSYVIYIHTSPGSFDLRTSIRQTWGQPNLITDHPSRLVFFLGRPQTANELVRILQENEKHRDLVMADYIDAYRNMTYKAISAFKWFAVYCPNVKYLIKADDDVYVDMTFMIQTLDSTYKNRSRFFLCALFVKSTMPILRDNSTCHKWCVPPSFMPGHNFYPPYCSGSAYILTQDLVLDLYNASLYTPYFFIDDVYATGLLKLKIKPQINMYSFNFNRYVFVHRDLEKAIRTGSLFPNKTVIHEAFHNAMLIRKMFAANLNALDDTRRQYISKHKLPQIAKMLIFYGITLSNAYYDKTGVNKNRNI